MNGKNTEVGKTGKEETSENKTEEEPASEETY